MGFFNIFKKKKEEPKDSRKELQDTINVHATKLRTGRAAIESSASNVRKLERDVQASEQDINTLESRIQSAIEESDDEKAKKFLKRLNSEKDELASKLKTLDEGKQKHKDNQKHIDSYNKEINQAKDKAKNLSIDLDLAEVNKEASTFDVSDSTSEIEQQINQANAEAEINRPDESHQEYLNAAEDEPDLDSQLAALKAKKGT